MTTSVSVKTFGAMGDGVTDDTAAFVAAVASGASTVHVPNGTYVCNATFTSVSNVAIRIAPAATLKTTAGNANPVFTLRACQCFAIDGGTLTSDARVSIYVRLDQCVSCDLTNIKAGFGSKSAYVAGIFYSTAAIFLTESSSCRIANGEFFNMEGCGLILGNDSTRNVIENNHVHDNITGILIDGDTSDENTVIHNRIAFNDVNTQSGADGILVNATDIDSASRGHKIIGNTIYNSGEHGMYFQAADSVISGNTSHDNAAAGIKVAKARAVNVSDNVCYSNRSGIQVQSGYDNIVVTGNICRLHTTFDVDFTYSLAMGPFGGEDVIIEGNYFLSAAPAWSIDASAKRNLQIRGNYCEGGIITTYIGTQAEVAITNNRIGGELRVSGLVNDPIIADNKMVNFSMDGTCSGVVFRGNVVTNMVLSARKDCRLNQFAEVANNRITSPSTAGPPRYELFNGQDADTVGIRFVGNHIVTAGIAVINSNGPGIVVESAVISDNIFEVRGGTFSVNIDTAHNVIMNGNVGVNTSSAQIRGSNSIFTSNTGGATFTDLGGSVIANNV